MTFGDMTISQIKEICDKNPDCSTCPLLLHIKESSPSMCVFNTPPWEWVPENPVKIDEKVQDLWHEGTLQVGEGLFHYCYKQYDECSEYGINGGRISKLMLKRNGEIVCHYDRGWDLKPIDPDTELALNILLSNN